MGELGLAFLGFGDRSSWSTMRNGSHVSSETVT